MRKHRLCVIRKQGDQYRPVSIRFHRDAITRECSVSLSGFGCMLMFCMIIAALVDRIEIGENYEVHIQFKVSAEQFIQWTA